MTLEKEFLRAAELLPLLPFSKAELFRRVRTGRFPKPLKLSPRVTVWRRTDIRDFFDNPPTVAGR